MTRIAPLILIPAALIASARMEISVTAGDTLVRLVSVRALYSGEDALLRVDQPYDPLRQTVRLLHAEFRKSNGEWTPLEEWAVERMDGTGGYPMSLQAAFTGLDPGDSLRWALETREWGVRASLGPWIVLPPPAAESVAVRVMDAPESLQWTGAGYVASREGDVLILRAGSESGDTLWISGDSSWKELADAVLMQARVRMEQPLPPDLREAALQATSAGADAYGQVCLARTLLMESFAVVRSPSPPLAWAVRDFQTILDSRRATPLEMAVLLSSICRSLGMQSEIIPATETRPRLPVPAGWNRFLVRARSGQRSWIVDPSAALSQSDHLNDAGLWMLRGEADRAVPLEGSTPSTSLCRERWILDPFTGTFRLALYCRGEYDAALRRRLAGLSGREEEAAFSLWLWQSGATLIADSVASSQLFRLDRPVEVVVTGRVGHQGTPLLLPSLQWRVDETGELDRTWTLPGAYLCSEGLSATIADDSTIVRSVVQEGSGGMVIGR